MEETKEKLTLQASIVHQASRSLVDIVLIKSTSGSMSNKRGHQLGELCGSLHDLVAPAYFWVRVVHQLSGLCRRTGLGIAETGAWLSQTMESKLKPGHIDFDCAQARTLDYVYIRSTFEGFEKPTQSRCHAASWTNEQLSLSRESLCGTNILHSPA
jgi:hypothetical protein